MKPEHRADSAQNYLDAQSDLTEDQRKEIAKEALDVMSIFADKVFISGSLAEVDVADYRNGGTIPRRIDRLVVTDHEVLIVDYKTDREPPDKVEDVPRRHLSQMATYRTFLQEIYPDRPVRCALLWTHEPHLMTLPDDLLDAALRDAGISASA